MLRASVSRISRFMKCKKSYDYKYNQKLIPRVVSTALSKGKLIHEALEVYDNGGDVEVYLANLVDVTEDDELIETVREVVWNYIYTVEANGMKLKVVQNEIELQAKLSAGISYLGYIDGIVEVDGKFYILERKTYSATPPTRTSLFNVQCNMYKNVYPKVEGVIWEYISSKAPAQPKLLKSGEYSLDKSQRITPYTLNGKPNVPRELWEIAEANQDKFVRREVFHFSDVMTTNIVTNFIEVAKDLKKTKVWTRNINEMGCTMCEYADICFAELQNGEDSEEANYVRTDRYRKEEEENERTTESQETE